METIESSRDSDERTEIWKSKMHDRLKMLLRRVPADITPTKDKVQRDWRGTLVFCSVKASRNHYISVSKLEQIP